jgi:SWI/SNF-related matrix-associated actin-dependent regulator of chromatin subfamily B protein 1
MGPAAFGAGADAATSRPSKIPKEEADKPEVLVPIRLEFDVEHHKMRDTFTWNLNGEFHFLTWSDWRLTPTADPVITPEMFAQTVVEDYGLAPAFHATITKLIQDQLSDYKAHTSATAADADDERDAPRTGTLGDADVRWWRAWRRGAADRARVAKGQAPRKRRKVEPEDEPLELDRFEFDEGAAEDDMRIVIKVDWASWWDKWMRS